MKRLALGIALLGLMAFSGQPGLAAADRRAPSCAVAAFASTPVPLAAALLQDEPSADESREELFKVINFLIMAAALVYFLRRPLADFFADRNDAIRQGLEEGRKALAAADARMTEVENKLKNLERDIAAFKSESESAMAEERERLKQAAEAESQRLMDFAQSQIESAARAAKGELKRYAAGQAVELAEVMIRQRLDDPARRGLVARFMRDLKTPEVQN
jgi:F-type H+-transporting ATPase subunit b